jgi:hypothetical protein
MPPAADGIAISGFPTTISCAGLIRSSILPTRVSHRRGAVPVAMGNALELRS